MDIKQITNAIAAHKADQERAPYFVYGRDYYISRNTAIMERDKKIVYYDEQEKTATDVNPFGANHKVPSGHFKKLVLQKVLYALGNGVLWNDATQAERMNAYFPEITFNEFIVSAGIDASKYGQSWAYAYIDNGQLVFALADITKLTPIYDEYGRLIAVAKQFSDDGKDVIHLFTSEGIDRYETNKKGVYTFIKHMGHYAEVETFNGEESAEPIQKNFTRIPFIPLFNNEEKLSDLYPIKPLIDVYDIIHSDFANNIDDMQDVFLTVKGYSGEPGNLARFIKQLKTIKAIPVSDEGDVKPHQAEVPVNARETYLKRLENDIYNFGMGVNMKNVEGSSITNVYIKAQMSDLDLKCDQFESEVRKFINRLIAFINENTGAGLGTDYSFIRSTIINETEQIDNAIKLTTLLSDETITEMLPFDIDYEQEKQRLDSQNAGVTLPPIEGA